MFGVFTAQCYASVVYAVIVCLSVCHLLQAGTLQKLLNVASCKQRHMIAKGLSSFQMPNISANSNWVAHYGGAK